MRSMIVTSNSFKKQLKPKAHRLSAVISVLLCLFLNACGGSGSADESVVETPIVQEENPVELNASVDVTMTDNEGKAITGAIIGETIVFNLQVSGAALPAQLNLSATRGQLSSTVLSTDANGQAMVILNSDDPALESGDGLFEVTLDGTVVASISYRLEAVPLPALSLRLLDSEGNVINALPSNGEATVEVSIESGEAGLIIEFEAELGQLNAATGLTDENGVASVVLIGDGSLGAGEITANLRDSEEIVRLNFAFTEPTPLPTFPITLLDGEGNAIQSIDQNATVVVQADLSGLVTDAVLVDFESDIGTLSKTNALTVAGIATVELSIANQLGAGEIRAVVRGAEINGSVLFEITPVPAPSIELSMTSLDADDAAIRELDAKSPVLITATVVNALNSNSVIDFNTTLGGLSANSVLVDDNGQGSVELFAQDASGVGVVSATIRGQENPSTLNFTINALADPNQQLLFVAAEPNIINLPEAGGPTVAVLRFQLVDSNQEGIANQAIRFALVGNNGGATLTVVEAQTDVDGFAETTLQAGQVATTARVRATLADNETVSTLSSQLTVSTGIPDQNGIGIALTAFNIEGLESSDASTDVTVALADHFNHPVPDGTTVSFRTEAGSIDSSCVTKDGLCSVTLTSSNIAPVGPDAVQFTQNCILSDFDDIPASCPGSRDFQPQGGLVTIVGFAPGEESFPDLNGNGVLDTEAEYQQFLAGDAVANESFDLADAFVDYNDDGIFNPGVDDDGNDDPLGEQERLIDYNGNGIWDAANQQYNGSLCRPGDNAVLAAACPSESNAVEDGIFVRRTAKVVFSGSQAFVTLRGTGVENGISIIPGTNRAIEVYITDLFNHYLPVGTTYEISGENIDILGETSFTQLNSTQYATAPLTLVLSFSSDDIVGGLLQIETTTPKGIKTNFSIRVFGLGVITD